MARGHCKICESGDAAFIEALRYKLGYSYPKIIKRLEENGYHLKINLSNLNWHFQHHALTREEWLAEHSN